MLFSMFLIGLGLAMDAFAVSVASGLALKDFRLGYGLWMGFYFGLFQFLMPLLGCTLGGSVRAYASAFGPYISFFLLAFLGSKAIADSGEEKNGLKTLSHRRLLAMAFATSIDALAAGVSFAFLPDVRLLPGCAIIGATTFALSFAGAVMGSKIPGISGKRAGILGGVVLLAIGGKLLIEGIMFP